MFTKAVTLDVPDANIIYKNISTEDLMDEDLMTSLRELMEDANVDQETLDKLFRSDEVIAPQDSLLS